MIFRRQWQGGLAGVGLKTIRHLLAIMILAVSLLVLTQRAQAVEYEWIGWNSDYNDNANWGSFIVPRSGDTAYFPDYRPNSKDELVCHTVDTPSGGLTVGEFIFIELKQYTVNVNGDLYFNGNGVEANYGIGNLYINAGTTTFTGGATATHASLVVNGGTLAAGSNNAWGDVPLTINSGPLQAVSGTTPTLSNGINLNGNVTFSGSSDLTLSGSIDLGNAPRTLTVDNTGHTYLTGTINLNADLTFSGSGDLTLSGTIYPVEDMRTLTVDGTGVTTLAGPIISGGGITKAGSGTLILSGDNSYNIGTAINAGTLVAASDSALGMSTALVELNGGTLQAGGTGDRTLANPVYVTADSCINGVATNALTLTGDISLQNSPCLTVQGAGNVTLAGAISGSNSEIYITSTGTLTLSGDSKSGDNPFNGIIDLCSGTLVAASDSALGYAALWLDGGTLQAGGTGSRTLTNGISVGVDSFINDLTLSGSIDLGAHTLTVSNTTLEGPVSGAGGLILDSGTLTLSGDNTYTGGTTISAGSTLVVAGNKPLGTSNLQLAEGTTLQAGAAGDCTLNNAVTLTGTPSIGAVAGHTLTLAGQVSGSGGFCMNSDGILTLSGADNPYTGITTVNSGTLASGAGNAIGQGATYINTGAKVNLGSYNQTFATLNGGGELTGTGVMTIGAGDFSGVISGTGGQVVKDTAGTLTLSGNNSYTGSYYGTTLNAGTLVAANDSALGPAALQVYGGTLEAGGAGDRTLDNAVNLYADLSINGVTSNALTLMGDINGCEDPCSVTVKGAGNVTLAGQISGISGLYMNSTGTLVLSGNNPYSTITTITAGTVVAEDDGALGGESTLQLAGGTLQAGGTGDRIIYNAVILTADSTLNGVTSNSLALTGGGIGINLNSYTLSVKGAGDVTLWGCPVGGTGGITMNSTGTLTLSGNNTYTGGTTITAGTLVAASNTALGAGAVKVGATENDVATLNLTTDLGAGNFTLNEKAVLQVAAGKTLTLSGSFYNYSQTEANWPTSNGFNLTMSGSTFEVAGYDYGVAAAGFSDNFNLDTLTVTGNLVLVDEANNGNRGGIHGDQEALYVNLLTGASGATLDLSGYWLYVYNGGDYFPLANGIYNDITVTGSPVPLPGSLLLLGSGLLGLAGWRRFRKT